MPRGPVTDHGLVPLCCGCAREPKRTGEARTAHPPASRREDSLSGFELLFGLYEVSCLIAGCTQFQYDDIYGGRNVLAQTGVKFTA